MSLDEKISLPFFTLTESATDATIRENLPEDHVFCAYEICGILKHLVYAQPKGEERTLLANGHNSLFYVKGKGDQVYAVHVFWFTNNREWQVFAWRLGVFGWCAEDRIFSRNC